MRQQILLIALGLCVQSSEAQSLPVSMAFTAQGLTALTVSNRNYLDNGVPLLDGVVFAAAGGQVEQGATNNTLSINASDNSVTAKYQWGSLAYKYQTLGNILRIRITLRNTSPKSIVGLRLTPLVLVLPEAPPEYDGNTPLLVNSIGGPAITFLTSGALRIFTVDEDVRKPLLLGFPWAVDKPSNKRFPLKLTIGRDNMYPDSLPFIERPIPAGASDTFQLSLRFEPPSTTREQAAKDVYGKVATEYPAMLHWPDRRPIASLIIATANAGWAGNPRGWFLDANLDTNGERGRELFHERLMKWADESIRVMRAMNVQGMITWDIEGEQFPHPTTYIGDPRMVDRLAPEMARSADSYFKKFRDAGFRVGVTIRPQELTRIQNGYSQQPSHNAAKLLIEKISYAKQRWGATLFYIDSNGDPNAPLDASVFEAVAREVPGILLIPEQKTLRYAASTAPYYELRHNFVATPSEVRLCYPDAFSVINVADGDIHAHEAELRKAVSKGDILLFRGWFNDPQQVEIRRLYPARR